MSSVVSSVVRLYSESHSECSEHSVVTLYSESHSEYSVVSQEAPQGLVEHPELNC